MEREMLEPGRVQLVRAVRACNGRLTLELDGSALYEIAGGKTHYRYRFVGQSCYLLYRPGVSPLEVMKTLAGFRLLPEQTEIALHLWPRSGEFRHNENCRQALNAIPDGSIPIGAGIHRVAWLAPDGQVVVVGVRQERPPCRHVLQPTRRREFGKYVLEWFAYAETRDITEADVLALQKQMKADGWMADDWHLLNVGRLADGTVVRIDPDNVRRCY